jgi:uncharacterized membrane protein YtjA (UPF0391 family)
MSVEQNGKVNVMLTWAVVFLVLAIAAAVFGFGGLAGTLAGVAQILFYVFLALLIITLVFRAVRGRSPPA